MAFLNDPTQTFNDPRRDWTDDSADRVHTVDASFDLLKLIPKTDIKLIQIPEKALPKTAVLDENRDLFSIVRHAMMAEHPELHNPNGSS